jgi:hypothetical protein
VVFGQIKTEEKSNEITAIPTFIGESGAGRVHCHDRRDGMPEQDSRADSGEEGGLSVFAEGELGLQSAESLYEEHGGLLVREYFEGFDFSASFRKNWDIQFRSASIHDEKHGRIEDRDYAVSEEGEHDNIEEVGDDGSVNGHGDDEQYDRKEETNSLARPSGNVRRRKRPKSIARQVKMPARYKKLPCPRTWQRSFRQDPAITGW